MDLFLSSGKTPTQLGPLQPISVTGLVYLIPSHLFPVLLHLQPELNIFLSTARVRLQHFAAIHTYHYEL
jgi:hypothetical protein